MNPDKSRPSEVQLLATEILQCRDTRRVPKILLRLVKILENAPKGSVKSYGIRSDIWKFDLLKLLILVLRQDFSNVSDTWTTAVKLADLTYNLIISMHLAEEDEKCLEEVLIPQFAEHLLILARRLQDNFINVFEKKTQILGMTSDKLLEYFERVITRLTDILRQKRGIIQKTVESPWFLQIFVTDDVDTPPLTMKLFRSCCTYHNSLCRDLPSELLNSILEEMIFDLSTSSNIEMASHIIRTLNTIVNYYPEIVEMMAVNYKGIRLMITRWTGKGDFGREIDQLVRKLDAKSAHAANIQRQSEAVTLIQKYVRGFIVRARLKRANKTFVKFQQNYRKKVKTRSEKSEAKVVQDELRHQLEIRRKRTMREKLHLEAELMKSLPAPTVMKHVDQMQHQAVTTIASYYRRYKLRNMLKEKETFAKLVKNAITIQRAFRKWRKVVEKDRLLEKLRSQAPISDERRAELLDIVNSRQYLNKPKERNRQELTDLYRHSQLLVHKFLVGSLQNPIQLQEREVKMSRLDADDLLLSNAPRLSETVESDVEKMTSGSAVAQRYAQLQHNKKMRHLEMEAANRWWKMLEEEDDEDPEDAAANYMNRRQDVMMIDGKIY